MIKLIKIIRLCNYKEGKNLSAYIFIVSFTIIVSLLELVSIYVTVPIFNSLTSNEDNPIVNALDISQVDLFLYYFIFLVILSLLKIYLVYSQNKFSLKIGASLSTCLYNSVISKNQVWHIKNNSSSSINNLTTHISTVISAVRSVILGFNAIFTSILLVIFLFYYSFISSLISIISITLVIFIFNRYTSKIVILNSKKIAQLSFRWLNFLKESLSIIKVIKLNKLKDVYVRNYGKIENELRQTKAVSLFISQSSRAFFEFFGYLLIIFLILVLYYVQNLDINNVKEIVLVYLVSLLRLLPHLSQVASSRIDVKSATASIDSVFNVFSLKNLDNEESMFGMIDSVNTTINFESIKFVSVGKKLKNQNNFLFKNFNYEIVAGDKILLVGNSGSGKSTLIDVISGFQNVDNGKMFINQIPSSQIDHNNWQKNVITLISQNNYIIDSNVKENLLLGSNNRNISNNNLVEILKLVGLDWDLDKPVGEDGNFLSGGERQRLIIARNISNINQLLIMDEATSALDSEAERKIIENIIKRYPNLTLIAIMHKPSTVLPFNKIIDLTNFK